MRLRMPESLALKYKIIFYFLSFTFVIFFCVYGYDVSKYLFKSNNWIKMTFSVLSFLLCLLALAR